MNASLSVTGGRIFFMDRHRNSIIFLKTDLKYVLLIRNTFIWDSSQ